MMNKRLLFLITGLVIHVFIINFGCAGQQLPQKTAKNDSYQDLFGVSDLRGTWQGKITGMIGGRFSQEEIKVSVKESTSKIWDWEFIMGGSFVLTFKEETPQSLVLIPKDITKREEEGKVDFTRDNEGEIFDLYFKQSMGTVRAHLLYDLNNIKGSFSIDTPNFKIESLKIELSRERPKDKSF